MAKDTNCKDCYFRRRCGDTFACHYLLMTNQRRPCEPGEGCTVKVTRTI